MATAACAGVLAATVMTGTPFTNTHLSSSHSATGTTHAAAAVSEPVFHLAAPTVPRGISQPSGPKRGSPVISVDPQVLVYSDDGSGPQPLLETPAMSADDGGCVHVG